MGNTYFACVKACTGQSSILLTFSAPKGDVVDRGADTIRLYDMLQRLRDEAYKAGGQVVPLLGNHEVMNLVGDWRYVYPEDVETFGSFEARVKAFEVDGFIGRYLTQLNMTAKVNRTIFCHGGIHPAFIDRQAGLDWINTYVHENLPEYMESKGKHGDDYGIFGGNGPTWYRGYALGPEEEECPLLEVALDLLEVRDNCIEEQRFALSVPQYLIFHSFI